MGEDIKKDYQENIDSLLTFGDEGYTMRKDDPRTKEAILKVEEKMAKMVASGEVSLFEGLNLSNKRAEGEDFDTFKDRRKTNKGLLKMYNNLGRKRAQELYPMGFQYAIEQAKKVVDEPIVIKNDEDATTI